MKKFVFGVLILSMTIISFVGLINFIIDPHEQYRKASLYKQSYSTERYMLPGIIKNYKYNTLIVGSSMMQNTYSDDVEKILGYKDPIKLTIGGASAYELSKLMKIGFNSSDNKIQNVIYALDTSSFAGDIDDEFGGKNSLPNYLYNDTVCDDYKYIFNLDTLKYSIGKVARSFSNSKNNLLFDSNKMFNWERDHGENEYGIDFDVAYRQSLTKENKIKYTADHIFLKLKNNFDVNLKPFILDNPNVKFVFFYPPRPVIRYKLMSSFNVLEDDVKFKKYIFNEIGDLKNVKIYDFNIAFNIMHNSSLYRDSSHYKPKINQWMLNEISNNHYLVTKDNIDFILQQWVQDAKRF